VYKTVQQTQHIRVDVQTIDSSNHFVKSYKHDSVLEIAANLLIIIV